MSENGVREPGPSGLFTPRNFVIAAFVALIALGTIATGMPAGDTAGDAPPADSVAVDPGDSKPAGGADQGDGDARPDDDGAKPVPQKPAEGQPPGSSTVEVAAEGSGLEQVSTAPPKTLSRIKMPEGVEDGEYTLVFQPFGFAPEGPEGKRLVVQVIESSTSESRLQDLTDRNMLLIMASYTGEPIETGGRYRGTVEVVADGEGRGAFYLRAASPASE